MPKYLLKQVVLYNNHKTRFLFHTPHCAFKGKTQLDKQEIFIVSHEEVCPEEHTCENEICTKNGTRLVKQLVLISQIFSFSYPSHTV